MAEILPTAENAFLDHCRVLCRDRDVRGFATATGRIAQPYIGVGDLTHPLALMFCHPGSDAAIQTGDPDGDGGSFPASLFEPLLRQTETTGLILIDWTPVEQGMDIDLAPTLRTYRELLGQYLTDKPVLALTDLCLDLPTNVLLRHPTIRALSTGIGFDPEIFEVVDLREARVASANNGALAISGFIGALKAIHYGADSGKLFNAKMIHRITTVFQDPPGKLAQLSGTRLRRIINHGRPDRR